MYEAQHASRLRPVRTTGNESDGSGVATLKASGQGGCRAGRSGQRSDTQRELQAIQHLARRETSLIQRWKRLLIVFLLIFASAVATGAFLLLAHEQHENYTNAVSSRQLGAGFSSEENKSLTHLDLHILQYDRFVLTIENAMRLHLQNIEGGMRRLSTITSAEAKRQNATWPFVTVPTFEVIGVNVREQTGFEDIALLPFVSSIDAVAWQEYSVENSPAWLKESREIVKSKAAKAHATGQYASYAATDYVDAAVSPVIFDISTGLAEVAIGEQYTVVLSVNNNPKGPFLPVWQKTPPPFDPSIINLNFLSIDADVPPFVSAVLAARHPLMGRSIDMTALAQMSIKREDHERYHASLVDYKSNETTSTFQHPHCPYLYPVYEEPGNKDSKIVALLIALLPFDRYLVNLLPEGVHGIDSVLQNDYSHQSFTYRLDGNSVRRHEESCRRSLNVL
jgi:hypothetical protein